MTFLSRFAATLLFLTILTLNGVKADLSPSTATLSIYVKLASGDYRQGSAVMTSSNGDVLTAYHVIESALEIEIFGPRHQIYRDIEIIGLFPDVDLATLRIRDVDDSTLPHYLPIPKIQLKISVTRDVVAYGNPHGTPEQQFKGDITYKGIYFDSLKLQHDGKPLFLKQCKIIPIDITAYRGMSGGPVVQNGKLIGILSGSLDEGRGLSWAIPVNNISSYQNYLPNPTSPRHIHNWPSFVLMHKYWRSTKGRARIYKDNSELITKYSKRVNELDTIIVRAESTAKITAPIAKKLSQDSGRLYSSSHILIEEDIDLIYSRADGLIDSIKPFKNLIIGFNLNNKIIDQQLKDLRPIVIDRISKIKRVDKKIILTKTLSDIVSREEKATQLFKQAAYDLLYGINALAEASEHKAHLRQIMEAQSDKVVDMEIREILKLIQDATFSIQGALDVMKSKELAINHREHISTLKGLLNVAEIVTFEVL